MSRRTFTAFLILIMIVGGLARPSVESSAVAGSGDPQIRTDHPWYPGELSCSTFERLFATQAELFKRVTGAGPKTDEERALASWLWRNTHYWHGEEGAEDLWGAGFGKGMDSRGREYWTGLFGYGFGLCGTTHSQWSAEIQALLGHGRGRGVGVLGHNSFEAYLKGGAYGEGRWALLDHDVSTVIFDPEGQRLLSLKEVHGDWKRLADPKFRPDRQRGWPVAGLHPEDGAAYQRYDVAEYLPGYDGPPPMVGLRRGETFRRYPEPGLEDGKTFVFWGRNMKTGGVPGPERSRTWVNQPEKMFGSRTGSGYREGQARFANAVFTYRPDFATADYREGVIAEDGKQTTFEFQSPYVIAATPPNDQPWGIYDDGCRNGLTLRGRPRGPVQVQISTDRGATWRDCGAFADGMDLTDFAKGRRHYWLRLMAPKSALTGLGLTIVTVCQANSSTIPRLKDNGDRIRFEASGLAVVSAGPERPSAQSHAVAGKFDSPTVTLALSAPRGETPAALYAAAHVRSSSPPQPEIRYFIDLSWDQGKTWRPVVKDWSVSRLGEEPNDFWSQSFCWGRLDGKTLGAPASVSPSAPAQSRPAKAWVRFRNNGGKSYARAEAHLVHQVAQTDPVRITAVWSDDRGDHRRTFTATDGRRGEWTVPTSRGTRTRWVEFEAVASGSR